MGVLSFFLSLFLSLFLSFSRKLEFWLGGGGGDHALNEEEVPQSVC
jgi:hypothetical protein